MNEHETDSGAAPDPADRHEELASERDSRGDAPSGVRYIKVHDNRPDGYDGTCLRPLGLCDLGGCCDVCWYRPDHPRFQQG